MTANQASPAKSVTHVIETANMFTSMHNVSKTDRHTHMHERAHTLIFFTKVMVIWKKIELQVPHGKNFDEIV